MRRVQAFKMGLLSSYSLTNILSVGLKTAEFPTSRSFWFRKKKRKKEKSLFLKNKQKKIRENSMKEKIYS